MTIKELEALSGMTRANIRFYEQEGLLSPQRQENGYRSYSEDDLTLLLKIKLLRQLNVSLDSIRKLQQNEMSLEALMEQHGKVLHTRQQELTRAGEVCHAIHSSRSSYQTLNPRPYLAQLATESTPSQAEEVMCNEDRPEPCPWRRYFARMLDISLYNTLWIIIFSLGARVNISEGIWEFVIALLGLGTMFLVEPLFLRFFGTTPGKAILGLRVVCDIGPLSYYEGLERTWRVFASGMGLDIPIYSLYRLWKSFSACQNSEPLPWEDSQSYVIAKKNRWQRIVFYIFVQIAAIALAAFVGISVLLPTNRAPLTKEAYIENFNYYMAFYDSLYRLEEDGHVTENTPPNGVIIHIGPSPSESCRFSFTEAPDGTLTEVSLQFSCDWSNADGSPNTIVHLWNDGFWYACLAAAYADEATSVFNMIEADNTLNSLNRSGSREWGSTTFHFETVTNGYGEDMGEYFINVFYSEGDAKNSSIQATLTITFG